MPNPLREKQILIAARPVVQDSRRAKYNKESDYSALCGTIAFLNDEMATGHTPSLVR